eukprot:2045293-Alexandrium_andersonii.AAC.1
MGDAAIADIPHFRDWDSDAALAEPDASAGPDRMGRPTYWDDITGAVLVSGLVESARAEEV